MRLFFSLLPALGTRDRLSMTAGGLKISGHARLLDSEHYHLTLAFVGEVPDSELPTYLAMGAALSVPRCAIELDDCEYWPASQAVVVAGRENPRALAPIVDQLRAAVAVHAPPRTAEKNWRAHVTLARKVAQAPVLTAVSVSWVSSSFALMRSMTGGGHAVYTVVDTWSLLDRT